ncbi:hypothetical protein N665_2761s0001 [Sinapis alba]|nr:hypothetical protein N665_2761s0001 [Sinapis alba]
MEKDMEEEDSWQEDQSMTDEEDSWQEDQPIIDESDQAWSSKDGGCERSWSTDEYSSPEYREDPGEEGPEPEPPDHSQGNTRLCKNGAGQENKSWSNDTDSEISMGEEDERDTYPNHDYNPLHKALKPASYGVTPYKDPEAYLKWEADMKQWLRAKRIPKEEKLSYALDMLIGKAYTWWKHEDAQTYYSNPVFNWGDLKARMYKEFVRKLRANIKTETSWLQKVVQSSKEILNQKEDIRGQGKSFNSKNLKDQTCYRCHRRGHFATVCPNKKLKETSLGEKTDISKINDSLIQSDLLVSNTCIMHLSMSRGGNTGAKEHDSIEEETPGETLVMHQNNAQAIKPYMLPKGTDSEAAILPNPTSTKPVSQPKFYISKGETTRR